MTFKYKGTHFDIDILTETHKFMSILMCVCLYLYVFT